MRVYSPEGTDPNDSWHIHMVDILTHPDYGSNRMPRLIVIRGQDYLFATKDYTIEPLDFVFHDDIPYSYPKRLHIFSNTQGYILEGEYSSQKIFNFTDVFAEAPLWLRLILLLFLDRPVYFRCLGEFRGKLTLPDGSTERLHLYGPYEYVIVR